MTSSAIRQSFLDFFREKQHTIVPSSSLLPDAPNLLFTNAGMNQFVPIFLGQAPCSYQPARAADTQKCIRAGGKHNDLEDVGFDTYHHTFFEMLGNWSFGDYFKKEAIAWAWELVFGRWHFPASRIYATVYKPGPSDPATFDQEAYDYWAKVFTAAGLDPAIHIVNGNKKDNFWMMGDTGPCGPCSELHVDLRPGSPDVSGDIAFQTEGRALVNSGDARCIEIWNLVFIQFNANPDGTYVELPAKHVDTGMGFERVTSMIQGTKGFTDFSENVKISNYETDVFRPIFDELEKITGKKYKSTLPKSAQNLTDDEKVDVAFRVIADHIRTLSFSIADGIQPSNEGRGYVLRRILRRAVRYGRNLGLREPFLSKLVAVLGTTMGHIFPEVIAKADLVKKVLTQEEESFSRTIDEGVQTFEVAIKVAKRAHDEREATLEEVVKLKSAWKSSDGRPDQFCENQTTEIAKINGDVRKLSSLDVLRYVGDVEKGLQKDAARLVQMSPTLRDALSPGGEREETRNNRFDQYLSQLEEGLQSSLLNLAVFPGRAAFVLSDTFGFPLDLTELMARERGLSVDVAEFDRLMEEQKARGKAAQKKEVITVEGTTEDTLPPTKFYGFDELQSAALIVANEGGALAVSETPFYAEMGGQVGDTGEIEIGGKKIAVTNTIKSSSGKIYFHKLAQPVEAKAGERVTLHVNEPRRAKIEAHHSGTHIMHWALRKVLGNTVSQKGSYVGPDRLRFDFSHGAALTHEEIAEVERLVNEKIEADLPASWQERPYTEVKGDPSILQFFGDKYGEMVRVVSIGDFSKELCGGTHVRQSGKIGYFKILHEAAIAAGIRRIEAASGDALRAHIEELLRKQDEQLATASGVAASVPAAVPSSETLPKLWQHYKDREKQIHDLAAQRAQQDKEAAKQQEAGFQKRATETALDLIASATEINGVPFLAVQIEDAPAAYLPFLADALKSRWQGIAVLGTVDGGKVALLAAVAPAHAKKIQAGKIIQTIAPLVGGKGGGRPELAQGGGTNPDGLAAALAKAEEFVRGL